jgi:hypothetical protein
MGTEAGGSSPLNFSTWNLALTFEPRISPSEEPVGTPIEDRIDVSPVSGTSSSPSNETRVHPEDRKHRAVNPALSGDSRTVSASQKFELDDIYRQEGTKVPDPDTSPPLLHKGASTEGERKDQLTRPQGLVDIGLRIGPIQLAYPTKVSTRTNTLTRDTSISDASVGKDTVRFGMHTKLPTPSSSRILPPSLHKGGTGENTENEKEQVRTDNPRQMPFKVTKSRKLQIFFGTSDAAQTVPEHFGASGTPDARGLFKQELGMSVKDTCKIGLCARQWGRELGMESRNLSKSGEYVRQAPAEDLDSDLCTRDGHSARRNAADLWEAHLRGKKQEAGTSKTPLKDVRLVPTQHRSPKDNLCADLSSHFLPTCETFKTRYPKNSPKTEHFKYSSFMTTLKATTEKGKNLMDLPPGSPELESTFRDPDIVALLKEIEEGEHKCRVTRSKEKRSTKAQKEELVV